MTARAVPGVPEGSIADAVGLRRRAPSPVLVGGVLLALVAALLAQRDWGPDGALVPVEGALVVVLGALPALGYLHRARRRPAAAEPIPFLPVVGLIYGLYYGFPVLLRDRVTFMSLAPGERAVSEALDLALVGLACLYAGFALVGRLARGRWSRPLDVAWDPARSRRLAVVLGAVGLGSYALLESGLVPPHLIQLVRLGEVLLQLALGIAIVLDLRSPRGGRGRLLLWLVGVPVYLFVQIRGGAIGKLIPQLFFVLCLLWALRFRIPWGIVAVASVCLILLRGSAMEFRQLVQSSREVAELSAWERSRLFVDLVQRRLERDGTGALEDSADLLASRTAQLGVLAHTVYRTPEVVPYWNGATYSTVLTSFVPRAVWRDKPTKELGQRFGHRYGVLHHGDKSTSVNLPQLVELYVNFGPLGVALGMVAMGALYRLLYLKLNRPEGSWGTVLIGGVIFSHLINLESDFSLVFGTILQTTVILYLILRIGGRSEADRGSARRASWTPIYSLRR